MVLTDDALLKGRDAVDVCRRAVAGGATLVQVRSKTRPPLEVAGLTRALVAALTVPVLVNDRVDVALAAGAAGAHLGQDDPPLDRLRPVLPPGFLLGISVGSAAEALRVHDWPADYWSVGPCYATASKPDAGTALGVAGLAGLARRAPPGVPVVAIGGITAATAGEAARAGARCVAAIAELCHAADPEAATRAMAQAFAR